MKPKYTRKMTDLISICVDYYRNNCKDKDRLSDKDIQDIINTIEDLRKLEELLGA